MCSYGPFRSKRFTYYLASKDEKFFAYILLKYADLLTVNSTDFTAALYLRASFYLGQCFSTFVRPRPGKLFFYKTRARFQQIYS